MLGLAEEQAEMGAGGGAGLSEEQAEVGAVRGAGEGFRGRRWWELAEEADWMGHNSLQSCPALSLTKWSQSCPAQHGMGHMGASRNLSNSPTQVAARTCRSHCYPPLVAGA